MRNTTLGILATWAGFALMAAALFASFGSIVAAAKGTHHINPSGWVCAMLLAFILARVDAIAIGNRERASAAEIIE